MYMSILEGKIVFSQHILYVLLIKQVGLKKNQILLLIQQIECIDCLYTLFCPSFHRGTFSPWWHPMLMNLYLNTCTKLQNEYYFFEMEIICKKIYLHMKFLYLLFGFELYFFSFCYFISSAKFVLYLDFKT